MSLRSGVNKKAKKKVIIIGAGPGGLSAGMILAHKGHDVTIYESSNHVGGRNASFKLGEFVFDIGPTFVMLPNVFEEVFNLAGKNFSDYVELKMLDPMYRLCYGDGREFMAYFDKAKIRTEIERVFPDGIDGKKNVAGYDRFMREQGKKFEKVYKCIKVPYYRIYHYLRWKLLRALPVMDATISVHDVLSKYFDSEDLKIAMAFQAKYLGMSPWVCPGTFTILSYMEHAYGVYHPMGGVHKISEAMAKVVAENGGTIVRNTRVNEIFFEDRKAVGVKLQNGQEVHADAIVMNADFARGMSLLVPANKRDKYSDAKLEKKSYSCSTFMIYLGLNKVYNIPHHNVIFSADYKKNVEQIFDGKTIPTDPSFYIQNASVTDPFLAPAGKSTIYILAPMPNLIGSNVDWSKEKDKLYNQILDLIEERTEMKDIRDHIEVSKIVTPDDWQNSHDVYRGAVFNLAHGLDQMLYLRPHNMLEGYDGLYIAGGGTHPGSGLPTIVESGRISAEMIDG